jgi:nitrogen fixation NifU-like protein
MSNFNELYQQVILEHNKKPRNFTVLDCANCYAIGKNPLCGDQFAVYVNVADDGTIESIGFQGEGCAISKASASLMTTLVKGKNIKDAKQLKEQFQGMITGSLDIEKEPHNLGKLTLLSGVKQYPARAKCATLGWHALVAALDGQNETSTESEPA